MQEFTVGPDRFDPYKNFKFRVKWDGRYVAGVSHVSPLVRTTEVTERREGDDLSARGNAPGRTRYEPITLSRGKSQDLEFENWANLVWKLGAQAPAQGFRKDITIEFYNDAKQLMMTYKVYRCWVSEYQAMPDLDANANTVAIEHIKLENEGWERDESAEPK